MSRRARLIAIVAVAVLLLPVAAWAYTGPCTANTDSCRQQRIVALEKKVTELDRRIAKLESAQPSPRPTPTFSPTPTSPATTAPAPGPTTPPTPAPTAPAPVGGQFTPAYYSRWANGPTPDAGFFPIGVWSQDPNRTRNGRTNALNYRDAGINTFVGLWDFPTRSDSESRLSTIKAAGMQAWASGGATLTSASALTGHQLGDEQDMNKAGPCGTGCNSVPVAAEAATAHTTDPTRPVYNNFGKGFALYPWVGYHMDVGPESEDDLKRYCAGVDIVSSDYYAATEGYEPPGKHTPRFYGQAVANTRRFCGEGTKPVLGFVETGHPFDEGQCVTWPPYSTSCTITPDALEWAVWSMLANGANGIIYFAHDFHTGWFTEDATFDHPATLQRMTAVNAQVKTLAPILNTPRSPTGLTAVGADATLRGPYVVAAENTGAARTVSFTAAQAAGKTVTVVGESRTLTADATGSWSDPFTGWGHHIYQIG